VRGLRWVEEPKLQGLRFILSSDGDKGVEDALQRGWGTGPDAGKRLAMYRQFTDQTSNRIGAEVGVGRSRVADNWKRRVMSRGKAKASLCEPMANDCFQVLSAANALHIWLRGKRAMPRENLETVEPTVLDYQEPSFMTEGIEAANAASGSFCDCVIHSGYPGLLTEASRGAGDEAWGRALVERDRPHPETVVKTEREVRRAGIA
jgi:hypothetical protein